MRSKAGLSLGLLTVLAFTWPLAGQTTRPAASQPARLAGPNQAAADPIVPAGVIYEKGDPIPGVRTVEGDPAGGLRWRLRMGPTASKTQPDRLIVWLHPSGESMNKAVEALAPELIRRGFALLVPTAKSWAGWSGRDVDKLLRQTLPDVARTGGVDVHRPILLGLGGGGQLALLLWNQSPEQFGGVALGAAYPVLTDTGGGRGVVLLSPPQKPAVKDCPLFVLCGEQDSGARLWLAAEDPFAKAGVPLMIHFVPGKGQGWLFGGAENERLLGWLTRVAAGQKPGAPTTAPDAVKTRPSNSAKPIRIEDVY